MVMIERTKGRAGADQSATTSPVSSTVQVAAPDERSSRAYRTWAHHARLADLAAIAIAVVVGVGTRFGWSADALAHVPNLYIKLAIIPAWLVILELSEGYDLKASLFGVDEARRVLKAATTLVACLGVMHFAFELSLSRGFVLVMVTLVTGLTVLGRQGLRRRMRATSDSLIVAYRAVVVGRGAEVEGLLTRLDRISGHPIEVVATVIDDADIDLNLADHRPDLIQIRNRQGLPLLKDAGLGVDLVIWAGSPADDQLTELASAAHDLGATLAVAPAQDSVGANLSISYIPLGNTPLLLAEMPALRGRSLVFKELMDRVGAAVLLLVLSPILAAIALTIAIRDGRPVFFSQERVGKDGKLFRCLKFRTMSTDAEARLDDIRHLNEGSGPLFKLKEDPRVTSTGRWLRAHSLDELPQLVNVFKGQMSLVGPRPALPCEVAEYDARAARRTLVKPGMTGLWQTSGRSDLSWDDGLYLDLMYVHHWSPLLDVAILGRTLQSVVRRSGAY